MYGVGFYFVIRNKKNYIVPIHLNAKKCKPEREREREGRDEGGQRQCEQG